MTSRKLCVTNKDKSVPDKVQELHMYVIIGYRQDITSIVPGFHDVNSFKETFFRLRITCDPNMNSSFVNKANVDHCL